MNRYHFLSLVFFTAAIFMFFLAFLSGEVRGGFFIVFPFIIGSGIYALLGVLLIFFAFVLFSLGLLEGFRVEEFSIEKPVERKVEGGGVVLIGPFPIIFGTSWRIALVLVILTIVLVVLSLLVLYKL